MLDMFTQMASIPIGNTPTLTSRLVTPPPYKTYTLHTCTHVQIAYDSCSSFLATNKCHAIHVEKRVINS